MNKYYAIDYQLYTVKDGESHLVEKTNSAEPFEFISGFGTTIPKFEENIEKLSEGEEFDFLIPTEEAYGEYVAERVVTLPRPEDESEFNMKVGAIIPLQNADGNRFLARITGFEGDQVILDLNHPLAGFDLNFMGKVVTCREATDQEITNMINNLSGNGGCGGCGGGGCKDGGCGGGGCKDGGCGGGKDGCKDGGCKNH